jgi:hypothetical protein
MSNNKNNFTVSELRLYDELTGILQEKYDPDDCVKPLAIMALVFCKVAGLPKSSVLAFMSAYYDALELKVESIEAGELPKKQLNKDLN